MARIDTTVSLQESHLQLLQEASESLGVSINQIVVRLYVAMMTQNENIGLPKGAVAHQEPKGSYKRMHVYLTPAEYEQKVDMRRLYKMSASYVLAVAIDWFLESLVYGWSRFDNKNTIINVYFYQKHDIIPNFSQKFTEYHIIWGQKP